MANILPREKKLVVLHHLVEGNTIRSTSRLTGVNRMTIQKLLVDFGTRCQQFQDRELRGLTLNHVECDEIWTYCLKKQSRLTIQERAERHDIGGVYVFTALDAETKLMPSYVVGKRSADNARRLMMDLRSRFAMPTPNPHASDPHGFNRPGFLYITQISSDAFPAYPEAVDLHVARRAVKRDNPHADEEIHPLVDGLLQEAGQPSTVRSQAGPRGLSSEY